MTKLPTVMFLFIILQLLILTETAFPINSQYVPGKMAKPIENYTLPPATNFIRVDSISGDLIWDTPADTGIFNVAMEIQEWRDGKKIGVVVRDMQIEVFNTNNKPPVNGPLKDYCAEVGDTSGFYMFLQLMQMMIP